MSADEVDYDVFLSHAGPDLAAAEELHGLLTGHCQVFLDSKEIELGSKWATIFTSALRNSRVSVVMVSDKTEDAYYQTEEIAEAIALSRQPGESHRVVPLYLMAGLQPPTGLRQLHAVTLGQGVTMADAAERLLDLLDRVVLGDRPAESDTGDGPGLEVRDGDGKLILTTTRPYLAVGRSPAATLGTDDQTVSYEHADLTRMGGGYRLRHLSETNPTLLRRPPDRSMLLEVGQLDEVDLQPGDEIEVGAETRFAFQFDSDSPAPVYRPTARRRPDEQPQSEDRS